MAFTSIAFMIFAPLFFLAYYWAEKQHRALILGVGSLIYYAYWDVRYVPLLLFSALIDYYCSIRLHNVSSVAIRRFWLLTALALNLGILFFFKYWNFFAENVSHVISVDAVIHDLTLPLGISFYTLQTLSYTFDVYRGRFEPEKNFATYFLYVSFFPQLIAGPIERASHLMPQIRRLPTPTLDDIRLGTLLIAWGFFAKLVIADNLAGLVADGYYETGGGLLLWPLSFFGGAQVYCDFFGYTLIARGLALYMGIRLSLNFRQPLFATSPTAFWQRWHISLTRWVMDYIHLPLARRFRKRAIRTLLTVMAMCLIGLWHGASWNFLLFGLLNGLLIWVWSPAVTMLARIKPNQVIANVVSRLALALSLCAIVPTFFIRDTEKLLSQMASMFSLDLGAAMISQLRHKEDFMIGAAMLLLFLLNDFLITRGSKYHLEAIADRPVLRKAAFGLIVLAILLFGNFEPREFIYFEF